MRLVLHVNGAQVTVDVGPDEAGGSLLWVLRVHLALTGSRLLPLP